MAAAEIILGLCLLAQALLLLAPRRAQSLFFCELLGAAGFAAAGVSLLVMARSTGSTYVLGALLQDDPLFRLPRACLMLAAMLLGRGLVASQSIPAGRKPEVLFLLSTLVFFCDLLLLSRNALLSCILLVTMSWIAIFLSGLAFRGRVEGEALLKLWVQASLAAALGFGSVLLLALVAGGFHFDVIAAYLKVQAPFGTSSLLVILALSLPFFLAGGIFPFHFAPVDRDQGVPWPVQLVLGILLQGAIFLAAWKMGIEVFGMARPGAVSEGMRLFQAAGLAGGFWLAIFSFTQANSKRLYSALLGAQWSAILAAGSMPSLLGLSSVTYAFSSVFLWSALLGFTWSRMQETANGDEISDVHGAARAFRGTGLVLLFALAVPLCMPGLPGFPAVLHLLASTIEQKSLLLLLAEGTLLALLCFGCLRVGIDLLFRPVPAALESSANKVQYGALDLSAIAMVGLALIGLGFLWHRAFTSLSEAAKTFL